MNLMEYMKNSTSRDFRINVAALQDQSDSDQDEEEDPMDEEVTNQEEVIHIIRGVICIHLCCVRKNCIIFSAFS